MSPLPGILAQPALGTGGAIPNTPEKTIASGYAEEQGALLQVSATDTYEATGSDPTQVAAVALTPGGADTSGFNILGRKEFPRLTMQGISVARGTRFLYPYMGTIPSVVDGSTYGATRDTDGFYKIDFAKVGGGVFLYFGFPNLSPADAAGSGQDTRVLVAFVPGIVQDLGGV